MKRSLLAASSVLMFTLALLAQQNQTDITRKIESRDSAISRNGASYEFERKRKSGSRGTAQRGGSGADIQCSRRLSNTRSISGGGPLQLTRVEN